jgi:hypothetical protein
MLILSDELGEDDNQEISNLVKAGATLLGRSVKFVLIIRIFLFAIVSV